MRIAIDLPEATLAKLNAINAKRNVHRSILIRGALDQFIKANDISETAQAFGAWKSRIDGLAFQHTIRDEW
jgi:metal-responsive CopG/Arc/MetJ family transcriptional regulator